MFAPASLSQSNTVSIGSDVIGKNKLQIGFQLDWSSWKGFVDSSIRQQLARDANFKLIRVFDFRTSSPRVMPCTHWDENPSLRTWDWTNIDALTDAIFAIGAEPLYCLGTGRTTMRPEELPEGMAIEPTTGLPSPESYAAYAREWVKHFKQTGKPVRFYEIFNEPFGYFGWTPNITKLGYYLQVFNACAQAMREEKSNLIISFDFIMRKPVLNYWLANHGTEVDSLNFHKYDGYGIADPSDTGYIADNQLFSYAETRYLKRNPLGYGINEAQQIYYNTRGKVLPIINSETNVNAAWEIGIDPRIQQMAGAVWTALLLRISILKGLSYNIYFEFSSSKAWEETNKQSGGYGFGMINSDDNQPWYPYYVNWMIGNNLEVGDSVLETICSSENVRTLAWRRGRTLNIFVINKSHDVETVNFNGVQGKFRYFKIDETISYTSPEIQEGITDVSEGVVLNGYTVMLLQQESKAMVGDITGPEGVPDGKVDMSDVVAVARLFGVSYPDLEYDPNCDITGPISGEADGKIDILDVCLVARNFGKTYAP